MYLSFAVTSISLTMSNIYHIKSQSEYIDMPIHQILDIFTFNLNDVSRVMSGASILPNACV